ncbi:MAG: MerR family DNA-binding protein [Vicinamibacteria bacterium]
MAVLQLAQSCGFRLTEMHELLNGFAPGFKASRRWKNMAEAKQRELDGRIKCLQAMRRLVAEVRKCRCAQLTDCGRLATSVMRAAAK